MKKMNQKIGLHEQKLEHNESGAYEANSRTIWNKVHKTYQTHNEENPMFYFFFSYKKLCLVTVGIQYVEVCKDLS